MEEDSFKFNDFILLIEYYQTGINMYIHISIHIYICIYTYLDYTAILLVIYVLYYNVKSPNGIRNWTECA